MENGLCQALERLVKIGCSDCKLTVSDGQGCIGADMSGRVLYLDKFQTNINNCDIGLTNLGLTVKLLKKYENVNFIDDVFKISGKNFSSDIKVLSPGDIYSEIEGNYEDNIKNILLTEAIECIITMDINKELLQLFKTYKNTYVWIGIKDNKLYVQSIDTDIYRFNFELSEVQETEDKKVCVLSNDIENVLTMIKGDIILKYTDCGIIFNKENMLWVIGVCN